MMHEQIPTAKFFNVHIFMLDGEDPPPPVTQDTQEILKEDSELSEETQILKNEEEDNELFNSEDTDSYEYYYSDELDLQNSSIWNKKSTDEKVKGVLHEQYLSQVEEARNRKIILNFGNGHKTISETSKTQRSNFSLTQSPTIKVKRKRKKRSKGDYEYEEESSEDLAQTQPIRNQIHTIHKKHSKTPNNNKNKLNQSRTIHKRKMNNGKSNSNDLPSTSLLTAPLTAKMHKIPDLKSNTLIKKQDPKSKSGNHKLNTPVVQSLNRSRLNSSMSKNKDNETNKTKDIFQTPKQDKVGINSRNDSSTKHSNRRKHSPTKDHTQVNDKSKTSTLDGNIIPRTSRDKPSNLANTLPKHHKNFAKTPNTTRKSSSPVKLDNSRPMSPNRKDLAATLPKRRKSHQESPKSRQASNKINSLNSHKSKRPINIMNQPLHSNTKISNQKKNLNTKSTNNVHFEDSVSPSKNQVRTIQVKKKYQTMATNTSDEENICNEDPQNDHELVISGKTLCDNEPDDIIVIDNVELFPQVKNGEANDTKTNSNRKKEAGDSKDNVEEVDLKEKKAGKQKSRKIKGEKMSSQLTVSSSDDEKPIRIKTMKPGKKQKDNNSANSRESEEMLGEMEPSHTATIFNNDKKKNGNFPLSSTDTPEEFNTRANDIKNTIVKGDEKETDGQTLPKKVLDNDMNEHNEGHLISLQDNDNNQHIIGNIKHKKDSRSKDKKKSNPIPIISILDFSIPEYHSFVYSNEQAAKERLEISENIIHHSVIIKPNEIKEDNYSDTEVTPFTPNDTPVKRVSRKSIKAQQKKPEPVKLIYDISPVFLNCNIIPDYKKRSEFLRRHKIDPAQDQISCNSLVLSTTQLKNRFLSSPTVKGKRIVNKVTGKTIISPEVFTDMTNSLVDGPNPSYSFYGLGTMHGINKVIRDSNNSSIRQSSLSTISRSRSPVNEKSPPEIRWIDSTT